MSENPIDTKPIGDGELNENSELTIKISNESKPKLLIPNGTELSREEIQLRRKHKKQLKLQKIQELKIVRRRREREKKKEKRKAEVALGIPGPNVLRKKLKQNRIDNTSNRVRVAIDLSYDELMSEKDIGKTARQLQHVYTANRKSTMPIKLFYTGIKPDSQIEIALRKYDGYKNWDIKFHEESYDEIFDANALVYLSSDSETVLQELESNAVYIIGGLVDHNAHKGLSYSRAQERGLRTARLPLCEYIEDMKTTNVLTIVHVFEILLKISEGQPWKETLLEVLPQRKFKPRKRPKRKDVDSNTNSPSQVDDESKGGSDSGKRQLKIHENLVTEQIDA